MHFVFEPSLLSVSKGEVTEQEFLEQNWHELDRRECDWYTLEFWTALQHTYCSDDERTILYGLKQSPDQRIFMLRCIDRAIAGQVNFIGIFYLPLLGGEDETVAKPQLLFYVEDRIGE